MNPPSAGWRPDDAGDKALAAARKAVAAGKYLVATARVVDGRVLVDWVSHDFPSGDFGAVVLELAATFRAEAAKGQA